MDVSVSANGIVDAGFLREEDDVHSMSSDSLERVAACGVQTDCTTLSMAVESVQEDLVTVHLHKTNDLSKKHCLSSLERLQKCQTNSFADYLSSRMAKIFVLFLIFAKIYNLPFLVEPLDRVTKALKLYGGITGLFFSGCFCISTLFSSSDDPVKTLKDFVKNLSVCIEIMCLFVMAMNKHKMIILLPSRVSQIGFVATLCGGLYVCIKLADALLKYDNLVECTKEESKNYATINNLTGISIFASLALSSMEFLSFMIGSIVGARGVSGELLGLSASMVTVFTVSRILLDAMNFHIAGRISCIAFSEIKESLEKRCQW